MAGDLGRYTLGDGLGLPGGYGATFTAFRDDGLRCVVKLIHGFLDPSAQELERLQVMLENVALVESDHVVPIIDAGVDRTAAGALPWIAMPQLPGARSLREVIADAPGPLGAVQARRIGAGLAQGLADLHAANMLHRGVKPGHVLLDSDGRPWLIGFELAKIRDLTARTSRAAEQLYMAPEQLRGTVIPETDLWALGLVLAELLTDRHPVQNAARSGGDLRRAILTATLVPDGLPADWRELLEALLRKLPSARPPTAESVVSWLTADTARPLEPRPVSHAPRWRWAVRSSDDVGAAEASEASGLRIAAIDASGRARRNRLRRAAGAIPAKLAFEPTVEDTEQLSLDDPADLVLSSEGDIERDVLTALRKQRDADTDVALLPWKLFDAAGFDAAIDVLRLGLHHRGVVGNKPVIATVQLPTGALTRPADALELAAVLCALKPSGWRLLVDGLQPWCGPGVLMGTADMAAALATRADVWVRASGISRWPLATLPGVSVLVRAGRGLWTRGDGGCGPRDVPERVEVPLLAGPVPRWAAERIAQAQPSLLECDCRVCKAATGPLPECGAPCIVHNAEVVDAQLAGLLACPAASRPEIAAELLRAARKRRAMLAKLIDWHAELDDLDDVLKILDGDAGIRRAGLKLLRFA